MIDPYAPQQAPMAPVPPQSAPEFAPPMPVEARAPASPTDQGVGLTQDQMKANLQGMLSQLMEKFAQAQSIHATTAQEIKGKDAQMLGDLFDFFESIGVDPSNPDEVAAFIEKLAQQSPELAQQLQSLLTRAMKKDSGVMPEQGMGSTPEGMQPQQDNMNMDPNAENIS